MVLVIDDDAEVRYSLSRVLTSAGYEVADSSSGEDGIGVAEKRRPGVVFLDNRMSGMSGLETLQHLRTASPLSMVILMTAFGTTQTAIEAMKYGAFDYIIKPFDIKKVRTLTESAMRAHRDLVRAQGGRDPLLHHEDYKEGIVGSSEAMQEVFKKVGQVAASEVTVMITGESGTGKELVARCLWQHSLRQDKPFIAVNCAAIPDNLIESELFGHERGAFTGATGQRLGKFELCDGGTLFLDEIGDMALPTQTKILRAIQEGEIQRVGGTQTQSVNVRVIAATNKDLEAMVAGKSFREDLYYRLNVMRIRLPALRERLSDIPQLVDYMLQLLAKNRRSKLKKISSEALEVLCRYSWPGNVRELENVIQRSTVIAQGDTILPKDLPPEIVSLAMAGTAAPKAEESLPPVAEAGWVSPPALEDPPVAGPGASSARPPAEVATATAVPPVPESPGSEPPEQAGKTYADLYALLRRAHGTDILSHIELEMIRRALAETEGNQVRASQILGMTRATLRKRIDEHSLRF